MLCFFWKPILWNDIFRVTKFGLFLCSTISVNVWYFLLVYPWTLVTKLAQNSQSLVWPSLISLILDAIQKGHFDFQWISVNSLYTQQPRGDETGSNPITGHYLREEKSVCLRWKREVFQLVAPVMVFSEKLSQMLIEMKSSRAGSPYSMGFVEYKIQNFQLNLSSDK